MARRWVASASALAVTVGSVVLSAPPAGTIATHPGGPRRTMTFPVVGDVRYTDTHGAPRQGGKRRHEGQDLLGAKMTPLVAAADGFISKITIPESAYGNALVIMGDDGWSYRYIHLNDDRLGTDDGRAPVELVFGPGIRKGARVKAGQLVAFLGDSGNAEDTRPHLHFELRNPADKAVNAANALMTAERLDQPRDLPDDYVLPPLGTTKATPSRRAASTSSTTAKPKATTTTTRPKRARSTTTTTRKARSTTTTAKRQSTTTTARRASTTSTTRRTSTTTTTRRSTTTTTRRPTTTTRG